MTKFARIRIVMERSFSNFDKAEKDRFLEDLEYITGFPSSDLQSVLFRSGCVIFTAKIGKAAAVRLLNIYRRLNNKGAADGSSKDIEDLQIIISRHIIVSITCGDILDKPNLTPVINNSIVFVHGWRGDQESFGDLPKFLKSKTSANIDVYSYPTGLGKKSSSIYYVARNLDNYLRNNFDRNRLAIISHSLGGIVVRQMLVLQRDQDEPVDQYVKLAAFIASPHNGSRLAEAALKLPLIQKGQLKDLDPNSSTLVQLNQSWLIWMEKYKPEDCQIRSIYGTEDIIVPPADAVGSDSGAIPILNAGHINIIKPDTKESEIVATLGRFLRDAGF